VKKREESLMRMDRIGPAQSTGIGLQGAQDTIVVRVGVESSPVKRKESWDGTANLVIK